MIQANELRTENLVLKEGLIYEIYSVNTEGEIQLYKTDEHTNEGVIIDCRIDDIEAIELTEEILLKCGFVKIENNWKVLDIVFASLGWERLAGMVLTLEHESVYLPHIKYLHQLQNLYFALTGEELEINL